MSNDSELLEYEINLSTANNGELNEFFLRMFGKALEFIMKRVLGSNISIPVTVKGTTSEVNAFAKTLAGEKNFANAYNRYGLSDPRTYESKYRLSKAIYDFERTTGIVWPFK